MFRHAPRPITEPGKGSYWQLDVSGGEGYKRPRKRRTRASKANPSDDDDGDEMSDVDEETGGLEARPQSSYAGSSQYSSPSSSHSMAPSLSRSTVDDVHIDPELRVEGGHVVGEGRTRPGSRRFNSPYANAPPPRYTQSAPVGAFSTPALAAAPEVGPHSQPSAQFGQSSFVQQSFAMPQRGQDVGQVAQQSRNAHVMPQSGPETEYARDQVGSVPTRRIRGYTVPTPSSESASQEMIQSQAHARVRTSQHSSTSTGSVSSSGSSQNWGALSSMDTRGKGRAM